MTEEQSKYISDDKRYGGKLLSPTEAKQRIIDLLNDAQWFNWSNDIDDIEKARECHRTIARLETAIAIPCAEYVKTYETKCIRDVGLSYTNDMLTPAEAFKRIEDMEHHIQFIRWGAWRPDSSDWAIMDLYERQIERLKKDLKSHRELPTEMETVECEVDLVTTLANSGSIQGTFVLKPKK
jgi:hypothetical protein